MSLEFDERVKKIANRAKTNKVNITTEEAVKQSLILPMLENLGYDIFDTNEVEPEYTADVGTKKNEKVDYAIKKDDKIIMIIECKKIANKLDKAEISQLYRYFGVSKTKFGVLTNGIEYRFYTDLDDKNKMDRLPFLIFNLLDYTDKGLKDLKRFCKINFEETVIIETAQELKWRNAILSQIEAELDSPSDDFVKSITSKVSNKRMTSNNINFFREIIKKSFAELIKDKVSDTLDKAINSQNLEEEEIENNNSKIITTEEEIQSHLIIQAIGSQVTDPKRIILKDSQRYCGIFLDNNKKTICRLHFNTANWYIGIFKNKKETKYQISSPIEIYNYADEIKESIKLILA